MPKLILAATGILALLAIEPAHAQNLLVNGTFDHDLSGWELYNANMPVWSSKDADGNANSGSLQIANLKSAQETDGGPTQCVPVTGGQSYLLSGKGFMPSGQAGTVKGWISVVWYSSDNCGNGDLSSSYGDAVSMEDTWETVNNVFQAPPTAASAAVVPGIYKITGTQGVPVVDRWDDLSFGPTTATCTVDAIHLCLTGNRFRVSVVWYDYNNGNVAADAQAVPFAGETGFFYFKNSSNLELMVKIHDACTKPYYHYWFFAAATTDVGYVITVTDTKTGQTEYYGNSPHVLSPAVDDETSFSACP